MWSVNSSVKSDNYVFDNNFQFNKVPNYNFDLRKLQFERFKIFMGNLYQNIYNSNQNLITQELEQMYTRFSPVSLDCNFFSCIMNSLMNYYLLSCSLRSQRYLSITERENMFKFNVAFKKSLFSKLSNSLKTKHLYCDIPEMILDNSKAKLTELSIHQSVQIYDDNVKATVVGKAETSVMLYNPSNDNEFRVFASVLDQDYTKSSKGYSCKKYNNCKSKDTDGDNLNSYELRLSVCDEIMNESSSSESKHVIDKSSFKSLQITSDVSFDSKLIYASEDGFNSNVLSVSSSDEDSSDCVDSAYNNVISRYFSTLESDYNKSGPYDFDSENSFTFSEDPCNINTELYDSDSEDSIIFSENPSNIKDRYTAFGDEDDSDIFIVFSNEFDSEYSTNCLNSNDCMSYPDSREHDLLSSDDESDEYLNCDLKRFERSSDICSLSQQGLFTSSLQLNFSFQGFENPCFEDDIKSEQNGKIKMVNDNWKIMMVDVSEEPRIAKKVSFLPAPELVTVQIFDPTEDNNSSYVLDRIRFNNRIKQFEVLLAPFLTVEHRTNVRQRNNASYV